jgi:Ca-activated chloride channel homolog
LEQELAAAGTFNQAKIRELLESLLPVLDFLHHQSPPVIHRDIKPANIIRRRSDGGLVLVDFGAAKQATQSMT